MADDISIRVRGLGKKYTLGGPQEKYQTFRDAIINFCEGAVSPDHSYGIPISPSMSSGRSKDVSFDVHKGEVIGIIGRNGAGKSIVLKDSVSVQSFTSSTNPFNHKSALNTIIVVITNAHPFGSSL